LVRECEAAFPTQEGLVGNACTERSDEEPHEYVEANPLSAAQRSVIAESRLEDPGNLSVLYDSHERHGRNLKVEAIRLGGSK
jgi:hypothetical protein